MKARFSAASIMLLLATPCYADPGMFNVMSFGATGNSVTDDTKAIQAAENAAEQFVGGAQVVFPPLTYKIASGPIYIRKGGMRWVGEGGINYNASYQVAGGGVVYNGSALVTPGPTIVSAVASGGLNHEGPTFENLNFIAAGAQRTQVLLEIGDFNRGRITRSSFHNAGVGVQFLGMSDELDWVIDGNNVFNNNVVGIDHNVSTTGGGNNLITGNYFSIKTPGDIGVRWQSGNAQGRVIGNKFDGESPSTAAIGVSTLANQCLIMGNAFENFAPAVLIPPPLIPIDGRGTKIIGNHVTGEGSPAWKYPSNMTYKPVVSLNTYINVPGSADGY